MTFEQPQPGHTKPSLVVPSAAVTQSSEINSNASSDPLLANFWTQLDRIQPTIPDRLSTAILEGVGVQFENGDPRLARLVSLAGQKFLTDILTDAMGNWRMANGLSTGLLSNSSSTPVTSQSGAAQSPAGSVSMSNGIASANLQSPSSSVKSTAGAPRNPTDRRATLTLDDLIAALNDRGIHVARPAYYR
ncbi:Transcription initiation factor TFIID subunit 10 [Clonorchis sinensis]|uniref:Transcription initiation factor TFIID subunit 10 n=2 Tax=Clonorchis sinensis TaxID=79923 RepID=G7YGA7_CLOSI|nr:Transcription initiation factor TFIID subunit 10 [Clonorchis sinensis]GAA51990.1 transcription initiation factor TFIID subunit 10 [Clonorchis sinensis]